MLGSMQIGWARSWDLNGIGYMGRDTRCPRSKVARIAVSQRETRPGRDRHQEIFAKGVPVSVEENDSKFIQYGWVHADFRSG